MNKWILGVLVFLLLACKDKEPKAEEEVTFFPIKSYMLSQAAQIDTSVYAIRKITTINSKSDTVYIRREDFRTAAKDFLELPDISEKKWKQDYHETKQFVEELNSAVLTYTPKDADDAEIRRQEVIIQPSAAETDQVKTIFIETATEKKNTSIKKKMLWEIDKWFRIVTITQKQNEPESIETIQVIWNN
jgi:hypothetical protein